MNVLSNRLLGGGSRARQVVHRQPKVEVTCADFSPTSAVDGSEIDLTVTVRLENTTSETVDIRWAGTVDGSRVTPWQLVDVPPNETITRSQTAAVTVSSAVPNAVGVRQRFGFQQEDTCGTIAIEEAPDEEEPAGVTLGDVNVISCAAEPSSVAQGGSFRFTATVENANPDVDAFAFVDWFVLDQFGNPLSLTPQAEGIVRQGSTATFTSESVTWSEVEDARGAGTHEVQAEVVNVI